MDKKESLLLKGVAICIMLFFHLFSIRNSHIYDNTIWLTIARANNPVPFYLILSGYGLNVVIKKQGDDLNKYSRLAKLFIRYWIILSVFCLLSAVLDDNRMVFSIENIFYNIFAIKTSFNQECWFILPYILLMLSAPFLFKLLDKTNVYIGLGGCYLIYMASAYMNRYTFFQANVFQYFYLLFPFVIGRTMSKYDWINKVKNIFNQYAWYVPYLLITLIVVIRCYFYTGAVITFYAAAVIMLFLTLKRPKALDKVLSVLGKHSTNMWMIHTWFCYYLFSNFIYGFEYPPIIFLVLIIVSLATSYILDFLINPITTLIVKHKNNK